MTGLNDILSSIIRKATVLRRGRCALVSVALFLALFLIGAGGADAVIPPAGTVITNQASGTFTNSGGFPASIQSNIISALVMPVEALTLTADNSISGRQSTLAVFPHRLTNTGNTTTIYTLTFANLAGDNFDLVAPRLYIDANNNGSVDAGETEIPNNGTVSLTMGQAASLLLTGTVPATATTTQSARLTITATSTVHGATATNTDQVTIPNAPVFALTKNASTAAPQRDGTVTFTVTATNSGTAASGTATINTKPLLVDGAPATLAVFRDIIPANTRYVTGSLTAATGTRLYHRSGDPAGSYRTSDAGAIDEVAVGHASILNGQTVSFRFTVTVNGNASGTIRNRATLYYNDGIAAQPASANTNEVVLNLAVLPPAIKFFTDNTFSKYAIVSPLGAPLFVQADASQCNGDALVAEKKQITIASELTGDFESYTAEETGPNTGVFRIIPNVPVRNGALFAMVSGNRYLEARKDDTITATLVGCGSASTKANLLIDPLGVVFDSSTNKPIKGATVSLVDVTGDGNGGNPGGTATVLQFDGVTPAPATVITGDDGMFQFPLVAASLYRLVVTPPPGYAFPSKVPASLLPSGRIIISGSYGNSFVVDAATGTVRVDVPLDPSLVSGLFMKKKPSRETVEVGEFLDYTIEVKNSSGITLNTIMIQDVLPPGFMYVKNSTRLNGVSMPDPGGSPGPALLFGIGTVASGGISRLTYRTVVGPGAINGSGINLAMGVSEGTALSNVASAAVTVQESLFTDKGYIVGKMFLDCNRNRLQDPEEVGIPGVRIYMENGNFAETDSEGKFSFYGVTPRTHVLKLDQTTLPPGAEIMTLSNRHGGDGMSRFADVKSGEIHRADFAEGSCSADVLNDVKRRREAGDATALEIERASHVKLTLDPVAKQDTKAQPASGLIGGAPDQQAGSNAKEKGKDGKPVAAGDSQSGPDRQFSDLQTLIAETDNSLGFLELQNGDVLPINQSRITVKGMLGSRITLDVNGYEVNDNRVGTKILDPERRIEAREYIGVPFIAGKNSVRLRQFDGFGNQRGELAISVTAPDRLAKIELVPSRKEAPADGQTPVRLTVRLTDSDGVTVTVRTPVTLETNTGQFLVDDLDPREAGVQTFISGGTAEYAVQAPREPGDALIRVSSGTLKAEAVVAFMPDLRPMIAAGLLEGIVSFNREGGSNLSLGRSRDSFERELRTWAFTADDEKLLGGGRAAFFAKGRVGKDYLVTAAYDSEKDSKDTLFRDIQPDTFYPVYGDSAVRGFDAQSTDSLYVRVDKGRNSALYGDFSTQSAVESSRFLSAYTRSLTGYKLHLESGRFSLDGFASTGHFRQIVEELPAKGLSGPYYMSGSNMIVNSEKVEIVTRDRNQHGVIVKSVPQARFSDYELEHLTGRILFKAAVPTYDADMNPNYIRITYEQELGGDKFWVAGAEGQVKITDSLYAGGAYVKDGNPLDLFEMKSGYLTWKPGEKTALTVEYAHSNKLASGSGEGKRVEFKHDGSSLQFSLLAYKTDPTFDNSSSSAAKGRVEVLSRMAYKIAKQLTLRGEVMHSEDLVSGGYRRGGMLNAEYVINEYLKAELGVRYAKETTAPATPETVGVTPVEYTSWRARISAILPWLPKLSLFGEYEQSFSDSEKRNAALGGEYMLTAGTKVYARHEFISSLGNVYTLNGSQERNITLLGIDTAYMQDGQLFSEYRMRDAIAGREAEASIGLRNSWSLMDGLRLRTTFERIHNLSGNSEKDSTAATAAVDYTANPLWKGAARLEYRWGETSNELLGTLGTAYKLTSAVTLLGRYAAHITDAKKTELGDKIQHRAQLGFAYRPVDTNSWNALARYEFKYEKEGLPADQDMTRTVNIFSTHLNYQPVRSLTLSGSYAGKLVTENSFGIKSDSTGHLVTGRALYDLSERWDAGVTGSVLFSEGYKSRKYGAGVELGYMVTANLWLSAGYNIFGFHDKDLSGENYTDPGFFFRFRFKFDENLFSGGNPSVNKSLEPKQQADEKKANTQ